MILPGIIFIFYMFVFTLHVNGFVITARIQEIHKLVKLNQTKTLGVDASEQTDKQGLGISFIDSGNISRTERLFERPPPLTFKMYQK